LICEALKCKKSLLFELKATSRVVRDGLLWYLYALGNPDKWWRLQHADSIDFLKKMGYIK